MLMRNLNDLYFSQSALIAYQTCPLKFRRRYLDGLFWPADWGGDPEQREAVEMGRIFHLMAQRYYSRGEITEVDLDELSQWFDELRNFRPYYENGRFFPEHEMRLNEKDIKLVVKYDLLYISPDDKMIIYDWKTNKSKPLRTYLQKHLQTITYRYVLAKTGGVYSKKGYISPENISIIYFNPRYPDFHEPIGYSLKEFERDEKLLTHLIQEIKSLDYEDFIATGDQKFCKFCEYCPICHGKRAAQLELEEEDMDIDFEWESIDSIQF